ncbi:ABC transporter permease [Ketobacter sp.]|uniref:ABC transporter permease n=1 Tax=Ketobacter sp. TaxID=2083498 RepID=UPI000F24F5F7|nr:FtsX-like permease family protein [Ketobacter sp.]RLT93811.1 MAG: FtsX-like permease family protein [Ketobacter sp.]
MRRLQHIGLSWGLALKDLWDDKFVSLCVVASLVAVIAPLMLLFGLKNGVVTQLRQELLSNPEIRAVKIVGNHRLTRDWIATLQKQPAVGFVMPMTRSLNLEVSLLKDHRHFLENVELLPSGAGDPLLQSRDTILAPPQGRDEIVISQAVATRLGVQPGETVQLVVVRQLDGQRERGKRELVVVAIVPQEVFPRPVALVSLTLLVAIEDFKDGYRVDAFGVTTGRLQEAERTQFAKVRLYANTLDDVARLDDWLGGHNIDALTQRSEIESVKAVDRLLTIIFSIIAWTAVLGAVAALIGALLSNIDRKRKSLAMLRLMGLIGQDIVFFIMAQTTVLAGIAFVVALLLFGIGQATFDQALASYLPQSAYVCYLGPMDLAVAFAATLILAAIVSSLGGLRALNVEPSESLRDF